MQLPQALLNSLESVNGFTKDAFVKVHESGEQVTSIRVNPFKPSVVSRELPVESASHVSHFAFHADCSSGAHSGRRLQEHPDQRG